MVGIGRGDPHLLGAVQPEDLGGNHRERGVGPAQVNRAGRDLQAAVAVEPTHRRRGVGCPGPAAGRQTNTLVRTQARPFAVVDGPRLFEALGQPDPRPGLTIGAGVALDAGVLHTQLERIDLQLARHVVDRALERERRLHCAGRPIGPGGRLVREHVGAVQTQMLEAVHRPEQDRRDAHGRTGFGARIEQELAFQRDERPVALGADLDSNLALGRRIGRRELFLARIDRAHRSADRQRQCGHGRLEEAELAAEAAADGHGINGHLVIGQAQHARDEPARVEQRLGRGVDSQVAERVDRRRARLGLQVRLGNPVGVVDALDDDVGSFEAGFDVAAREASAAGNVGLGRVVLIGDGLRCSTVHGQLLGARLALVGDGDR